MKKHATVVVAGEGCLPRIPSHTKMKSSSFKINRQQQQPIPNDQTFVLNEP